MNKKQLQNILIQLSTGDRLISIMLMK